MVFKRFASPCGSRRSQTHVVVRYFSVQRWCRWGRSGNTAKDGVARRPMDSVNSACTDSAGRERVMRAVLLGAEDGILAPQKRTTVRDHLADHQFRSVVAQQARVDTAHDRFADVGAPAAATATTAEQRSGGMPQPPLDALLCCHVVAGPRPRYLVPPRPLPKVLRSDRR